MENLSRRTKKTDDNVNDITPEFHITYRCELLEWVVSNQSTSFSKLQEDLRNETFRDKDGILRYIQNWLPAPEQDDSTFCDEDADCSRHIKHFLQTGCSDISFSIPAAFLLPTGSKLKSEKGRKNLNLTVRILSDWERLWRNLVCVETALFTLLQISIVKYVSQQALDNTEEMGEHAALLCAFIGFFMHVRSLRLFWVLLVYDGALTLWFSYTTQSSSGFNSELTSLLHKISCGIFYVVLRRLYVDDISRDQSVVGDSDRENNPILSPGHQSDDESSGNGHSTSRHRHRQAKNRFKYTLHWRGALQRCVKLILLELQALLCRKAAAAVRSPAIGVHGGKGLSRDIVSSFEHLINVALKFLTRHCEVQINKIYFNRAIYQFTFLTISVVLPIYCICYWAVVWLGNISICQQESSQCTNVIIYTVMKLGYLTDIVEIYLMYGSLCVSIVGLTYGTEVAYYMAHYWMNRYGGLRKVSSELDEDEKTSTGFLTHSHLPYRDMDESKSPVMADDMETSPDARLKLSKLSKYLQTDAAESYLFIVEYMRQSGTVWSPAIIGMYVYSVILMLALTYLYGFSNTAMDGLGLFTLSSYFGQAILFTIFPTWSLAHANSLISPILEMFNNASEQDFAIIGSMQCSFFFFVFHYECMYVCMYVYR